MTRGGRVSVLLNRLVWKASVTLAQPNLSGALGGGGRSNRREFTEPRGIFCSRH